MVVRLADWAVVRAWIWLVFSVVRVVRVSRDERRAWREGFSGVDVGWGAGGGGGGGVESGIGGAESGWPFEVWSGIIGGDGVEESGVGVVKNHLLLRWAKCGFWRICVRGSRRVGMEVEVWEGEVECVRRMKNCGLGRVEVG